MSETKKEGEDGLLIKRVLKIAKRCFGDAQRVWGIPKFWKV